MVMRRVFNHHVCLCVLSTAILAGLALMTSQTKVYAGNNCKGVVSGDGGSDSQFDPIVCDGGSEGSGKNGELTGNRNINMGGQSGAAVTITGSSTKIRIKSTLTVTDSKGSRSDNDNPAIKVDGGGELTVDDADVGGVKKGIVVENKGSSVTVMTGSIGVGKGGGPVIEVSNNGRVVLNDGVTVTESGGREGEVVIDGGGTVQLGGVQLKDVTTGMVVKGGGKATVRGGGATITVKQGGMGGTGFKMQGQANASATVVDMTINGSGGGGNRTGVEMGSTGTLTMTKVTLEQLETGAKVTRGTLELNGGSKINVVAGGKGLEVNNGKVTMMGGSITGSGNGMGLSMTGDANVTLTSVTVEKVQTGITKGGSGTLTLNGDSTINVVAGGKGLEVTGGTANVMGATITLQGNRGKGLEVNNGKVTMMGGSITGSGNGMGTTGVEMKGSADVTLTRVTMKQVAKGVVMAGNGTLTLDGTTKINVGQNGTGLDVSSGKVTMNGGEITAGNTGTGLSMTGDANVTLMGVEIKEVKTGVVMTGNGALTLDGGSITGSGSGTGINATDGNVTVKGGARIEGFTTGINMKGSGELKVEEGTRITVGAGGKGVYVGGSVQSTTLTGVTITGSGGNGSKGVEVKGSANVTLTRVTMKQVGTGVEVAGNGTLTLDGGSITGSGSGTGINVTGGSGNVIVKGVNVSEFTTGIKMMGKGTFTVEEGTTINVKQGGTGVSVGDKVTNTRLTGVTITGSGSGYGVKVEGGAVVMNTVGITGGETGVLMGESVTKATLTGVTIKEVERGITMMGSGELKVEEGTRIQFTGNDQDGYGVMVGTSVTEATLTNVTITGSGTGKQSRGVWVKGGMVTMNRVEISKVGMGIYAMGGSLTVSGGSIGFTGTYGVMVEKGVTSAELTKVTIKGNGNNGMGVYAMGGEVTMKQVDISNVGMGIYAMGGNLTVKEGTITGVEEGIKMEGGVKNASLTGVTIKGAVRGIVMEGSGEFTVSGGTRIEFTGDDQDGYGVSVGKGVTSATLTNVTITGNKSGGGIWVKGGSGNVTLTRVTISKVKAGIAMMGSGELKVGGGTTIQFEGDGYGIGVWGSVKKAELTGVMIEGSGGGVWVKGGTVMMKQVGITLQGSGTGIYMGTGVKNATLTGLTITGAEKGVAMMGSGELKVENGTRIEFTGDYGVYVGGSVASTTLTGVTITGSGGSGSKGVGIYAMGGEVTMKEVDISNVGMGIWITGGSLTAKEGTKIQFTKDYGIKLGKGVTRAELKDVTIRGGGSGGYGVYAEGGVLMVSGGSITGVEEGIKMMGYGVLKVKGGTRIEFTGEYGYGVYAGKRVKNTSLIGVKIEGKGSGGYGVYAEGGSLTVSGGSITGVKAGIFAVKGGTLTVKDNTRIEFVGDGYGVYVGKSVTSTSLTDVTIEGSGTGMGVWVEGGAVWLKETHLRDVAKGMTIEEGVVRMEGGSVEFTKDYGISLTGGYVDLRKVNMTYTSDGPNANFIKVEGGKVLAEGITMTGNGGKGQGVKVAKGGVVWLKDTHFTNVKSGMTISEGSVFMFKGGITFKGEYGIYLSKGHALLSGFDITGPGGTSKTTATGIGVVVSGLGEIMMRRVDISGVEMGVQVTGGLLVMDKGDITFKGKHGINLVSGYALLNGVKITGPGSGTGIELGYGQVLIKDTTFINVDKAITVTQGDVKMEGGEIEFKGEHGILLGQGGVALMGVTMRYKGNSTTADFIKITGEDTTNAVEAVDPKTKNTFTPKSAVVVAASLKIDGSGHGQALKVTNGGRVVLVNPTYTDVYTGMTITKGAVQMLGGEITFKGDHGILLKRGHALLTNVTMEYKGHEKNTTFLKVEATKVVNSKNERILNTADIRVTGIKIEGNGKGQGVYVANGGRVMLQSALLSNVINGVSVANGEFWMKGGEIAFKGDYGVSLSTGKVLLKRVIMKYKGDNRVAKGANTTSPNFIKVDGRGANLAAIKVVLTGNEAGLGVKVSNGGHVTLKHMFFCIVCECVVYFFLF
ncbi:beta strand repeat-containing protein [Bartonella schoenbuchensis]|uniref:beta strand repeat-containing protein n=1 Tax=Bartonella schoenbuchensis TaxID=165694 RepID=UPI0031455811